jgi:hypothetical protein
MPDKNSDCALYCEHANEAPVDCRCSPDCYCRVHGSCKLHNVAPVLRTPNRSCELVSVTKVFVQIGYAPPARSAYFSDSLLADEFRKVQELRTNTVVTVSQHTALRIMATNDVYLLQQLEPIALDSELLLTHSLIREAALAKLTDVEKQILGVG